ncbi:hypothetical protein EVAR_32118_1 [Eumeta japonica]|uniref:Uncharacterized protein n=1 Tax=Eumeta variegata TaxID=151549 RepID=A0A4C1V539_EUMVA|nr:hypothetical protein EVAR_32118_1 [Eumeta japonica]
MKRVPCFEVCGETSDGKLGRDEMCQKVNVRAGTRRKIPHRHNHQPRPFASGYIAARQARGPLIYELRARTTIACVARRLIE